MKARPVHVLALALVCSLSVGCTSTAGKAAKRDATNIRKDAATAGDAVNRAQAGNVALRDTNAQLGAQTGEIRNDAQRIDDKAVVLLKSRWQP